MAIYNYIFNKQYKFFIKKHEKKINIIFDIIYLIFLSQLIINASVK